MGYTLLAAYIWFVVFSRGRICVEK